MLTDVACLTWLKNEYNAKWCGSTNGCLFWLKFAIMLADVY
jgi:hypothetical protein